MPIPEEIQRYCANLVTVVTKRDCYEDGTIVKELQLTHFSVKEYLIYKRLPQDIGKE
jgi:hypothetical protein